MRHLTRRFRPFLAALLAFGVLGFAATAMAADGETVTPKEGTVYYSIAEGLKLIKDGKFDAWKKAYCHTGDLCYNDNAWRSVEKYNLPALQRLAPKCLKDGGKLLVTKVDGDVDKDDSLKIFIECDPKGMPRPFYLKKDGKTWKFTKI
ncbi:MAG: hypothetical protein KC635_08940 [Myxococcales bacterium]|nr:hypothetical protein [Myxococcales bacterium]MCB9734754.1 hypothetical protein [Deltaproteobacteria bacterium]